MKKVEEWATLRFASMLSHSDNRRICDSHLRCSPKLPLATSHTRKTLSEIVDEGLNMEVEI